MKTASTYYLIKLRQKYLLLRLGEIFLLSLAVGCALFGIGNFLDFKYSLVIAFIGGSFVFAARYLWLRLHVLNQGRIVNYINQRYPQLENSADLLLEESKSLSSLQQIQREKIEKKISDVYPVVKFPHRIAQSVIIFVISILIAAVLTSFDANFFSVKTPSGKIQQSRSEPIALPAEIRRMELSISPPSYTKVSSSITSDPRLKIPEASTVSWNILFSDTVQLAQLVFSGGDSLKLLKDEKRFIAQRTFQSSNFYQLQWVSASGELKTSDYYPVEVIRDKAPEVTIRNLAQFTHLVLKEKLSVDVAATLSDDYGLTEGYIIATVSKGSGESVKFREEKLNFDLPSAIKGKQVQATRTINLPMLGMEPGDELYFYVEALDNKTPMANRSRTETFFIALQDTITEKLSVEGGLGVDLMPEYFRSQRQIIIDTEKLLKEKRRIAQQEFKSKSNNLGYDQKVLRLRYGQFLGEEFETGIGFNTQPDDHDDDVMQKFGHEHDKDNEHNHVPEKRAETHQRDHKTGDPEEKENPFDAFLHRHDSEEEATFFIQSIRAKLKAALTVMWDAELYLRLYEPEKSLPYQYQALKLLKEISNDSRIYVHKTGFDPPPVKEDKRLTGDLAEIKSTKQQTEQLARTLYPGIRLALQTIEELLLQSSPKPDEQAKKNLLQGGKELSALALEKPGQYLKTLSLINHLTKDEVEDKYMMPTLLEIRNSLWHAMPQESPFPYQKKNAVHSLDRMFIENLNALKNDR